ncbi:MAG: DUF1156 domain-containing protein [Candidatus Hodarchaeales archaeon]
MKLRLIEWYLPLREISKCSSSEKSVRHGHPSTLHTWWARRPLSVSRASCFASLIELPESDKKRNYFIKVIKDILPWNTVKNGNTKPINLAQEQIDYHWPDHPPKVLDPFSGGGSIPLEAMRLGCDVYANELNPVAVFIQKATLEWPHLFSERPSNLLANKVLYWASQIRNQAYQEIGQFFPPEKDGWIPIGFIWARTIYCPKCYHEIPLIRHFWLAKKKEKKIAYKPIIDETNGKIQFIIQKNGEIDFDPSIGTVQRGNARCLFCDHTTKVKTTRKLASQGKMGERLLVVILHHPTIKGKRYRLATQADISVWKKVEPHLKRKLESWNWELSPLPEEELPPAGSLGVNLKSYGYNKWKSLFNPRQQLALITFLDLIKKNKIKILEDCQKYQNGEELYKAIMGYLAIILGRLIDKNANLVVYNTYGEKIEHVFGRTALPMKWDYAEVNVFSGANGDWDAHTKWVIRFIRANSWKAKFPVKLAQGSATRLSYPDSYFDAILTDPPYYDNVPYSDLSDFFYVWLKRAIGDLFPELFCYHLTPKEDEIVANKSRQADPKAFFEKKIEQAFQEMYRTLKPEGILVLVYAHRSLEGWETMLTSLIKTGFVITASWPIQTELKTRLRARYSAALSSSIYIICRKIKRLPSVEYQSIEELIRQKILSRLAVFWGEGIRGGDFFISAIGPAMEIYSKYEAILSGKGKTLAFYDLFVSIKKIATSFLINNILKTDSKKILDPYSRFYLLVLWIHCTTKIPISSASELAASCGLSLNELWCKGGFIKRDDSSIKLLFSQERLAIPNYQYMINIMHRALHFWKNGQEEELILFFKNLDIDLEFFWHYCQSISELLEPKEKEKQLLESLLVQQPRLFPKK